MLLYLEGHTRPDISFAVNQCARYTFSPRKSHEEALKHIGRYLKLTKDKEIIMNPKKTLQIDCFVDADFAGLYSYEDSKDPTCVRSIFGHLFMIGAYPLAWKTTLQGEIAQSTMEAEYVALSTAMKDLIPLQRIVKAVAEGIRIDSDIRASIKSHVWEDNAGALTLARLEPPRITPRSKHYAIKYHWFRNFVKSDDISLHKIDTKKQLADLLTKSVPRDLFRTLRKLLMGW